MKRIQARLWVVALLCIACGVASRFVFSVLAPPLTRAHGWEQWSIEVFWYATALLLFLAHVWRLGTSGRPPDEAPSLGVALLWVLSAVLVFLAAASFSLPRIRNRVEKCCLPGRVSLVA